MSAAYPRDAESVVNFWFGTRRSRTFGCVRDTWFRRDDTYSSQIHGQFRHLIDAGMRGQLDHWEATALGALALILVLDQFPRNCYRDSPRAFASESIALRVARAMIARELDLSLPTQYHKAFAYLPFVHDENLVSQFEALRLYTRMGFEQVNRKFYFVIVKHAKAIERFGRFPHRNSVLGRSSSDEELAFIREHPVFD
jgi:uncharacterized protein (DUF924 family)